MQTIILVGLQACGKSTFYKKNFIDTHIRINLDMLKTRNREKILLKACIEAKQKFVVDNTNPCILDRQKYISLAKEAGFEIVGYYFCSNISRALERNRNRKNCVPEKAILSTFQKLEIPSYKEGFDQLYYVEIAEKNQFIVKEWQNEV